MINLPSFIFAILPISWGYMLVKNDLESNYKKEINSPSLTLREKEFVYARYVITIKKNIHFTQQNQFGTIKTIILRKKQVVETIYLDKKKYKNHFIISPKDMKIQIEAHNENLYLFVFYQNNKLILSQNPIYGEDNSLQSLSFIQN